jgi:protein-S-isoprenylcysteine O-methyltransferase Ste14
VRTKGLIARYLGQGRQIVVDVGGGAGAYTLWLAEQGHEVHFIDIVPRHIEIVKEKARERSLTLGSARVGDARSLAFEDQFADLVLLMGPLYHLTDQGDRIKALRDCARVVKRGGRVLCTAISRFASLLAGFRFHRFDDAEFEAMVDRDLLDGQHRNLVEGSQHFRLGSMILGSVFGWVGLLIAVGGMSVRWWANRTLGEYYTRTLRVTAAQFIIQEGPYRMIRHPGYLGSMLMWVGAGLATTNWIAFILAVVVMFGAYYYRIQAEEQMLMAAMSQDYREYESRTWKLIPFVF